MEDEDGYLEVQHEYLTIEYDSVESKPQKPTCKAPPIPAERRATEPRNIPTQAPSTPVKASPTLVQVDAGDYVYTKYHGRGGHAYSKICLVILVIFLVASLLSLTVVTALFVIEKSENGGPCQQDASVSTQAPSLQKQGQREDDPLSDLNGVLATSLNVFRTLGGDQRKKRK